MIKMVVFDMAGTTIDEDNVVYKTLQKCINEAGFNFSLQHVLAYGAGKEKSNAIQDIIGQDNYINTKDLTEKIYANFITALNFAYENIILKPQPGAIQLFTELRKRDILITLNTGYNSSTALLILEKLGWQIGHQIDCLVTASDVKMNRPNPDMILLAMQQMNIDDAEQVVKVGDSIIDIEEGKNAGCSLSIGITTGAHTYDQLATAKPNFIIQKLSDLINLI